MKEKKIITSTLLITLMLVTSAWSQSARDNQIVASKDQVLFYTSGWEGARLPDGRPKVSDKWLERVAKIKLEDAWQYLYERGYRNQFESGWEKLHPDQPIVGRVLTAQFMPARPGLKARLEEQGRRAGRVGPMNTWPIALLQSGDVYVADAFGKIAQGTLIGSNLGSSIFARTGKGVVFNGAARDAQDLEQLEGFNAFVRDWHPSFLEQTMLTGVNVPIRIGRVTVLPGDVVLAKENGVVFIPPQMVKPMVITAEIVKLRDEFAQLRVRQGVYSAGQIDTRWTPDIEQDFLDWLGEQGADRLPVPMDEMQEFLKQRTW